MQNHQQQFAYLRNEIKLFREELKNYGPASRTAEDADLKTDRISRKMDDSGTSLREALQKQYYKIKPAGIKSSLSEKIFCAVVNYNENENAIRLRNNLSRYFDTALFDSDSRDPLPEFIRLENVYYSGLFNKAYAVALEMGYTYLLFICSDVVFEETETDKMVAHLQTTDLSLIGIYSPASDGRSHAYCKMQYAKGMRPVPFVEGFVFLTDMQVLKAIAPVDLDVNRYGWGLDVAKGFYSRKLGKLCVIDDGVTVFHPGETGYSNELAEKSMNNWIATFEDEEFKAYYAIQIGLLIRGLAGQYKVSVIVTCTSQAADLQETINSLLLQEHGSMEIFLLISDSSGPVVELAMDLCQTYVTIKLITLNAKGHAIARNEGLKAASGDYIQFVRAGNILSVNKISSQVYDFVIYPQTGISCSESRFGDAGRAKGTQGFSKQTNSDDLLLDLIENWNPEFPIPLDSFLFKRSVIGDIRFHAVSPEFQDWDFLLQMAGNQPNYLVQKKGFAWYHPNRISAGSEKEFSEAGKKKCIQSAIESSRFTGKYLKALQKRLEEN
jgi:hypothetical protein